MTSERCFNKQIVYKCTKLVSTFSSHTPYRFFILPVYFYIYTQEITSIIAVHINKYRCFLLVIMDQMNPTTYFPKYLTTDILR